MMNFNSKDKWIFAFDIDGTILDKNSLILPETKVALAKASKQGHILVLASGRPYFDMVAFAEQANNVFSYMVCNNGSYFYDVKLQEFFYRGEVPHEVAFAFLELAIATKTMFALHQTRGVYRFRPWSGKSHSQDEYFLQDFDRFHEETDIAKIKDIITEAKVTQVSIFGEPQEVIEANRILSKFSKISEIRIAGSHYLDANPKGASKLTGIADLASHINCSVDDFVVFGDSGNDLEMLEGIKYSYCMGNGTESAKKAAFEIIGDHNEPAIAQKLEDFLTQKITKG